jgi:hypothetical protein
LRAEFLAALGAPAESVAAELDLALAIADRQGAALFTLRAAASCVRLAAGDPTVARERLAAALTALDTARETPDWADAAAVHGAAQPGSDRVERLAERSRNASTPIV